MAVRHIVAACLLSASALAAAAPVPKEKLLVPPGNAEHFLIVSSAGKHGDEWRWTLPDGSTAYRQSILLRGLIFEQDQVVRDDDKGLPVSITIRGVTPQGDSAETYVRGADGTATWVSQVDKGSSPLGNKALYVPAGGTFLGGTVGLKALVAAGATGIDLLPGGHGALESGGQITLDGPQGPKTARLYFLKGASLNPPAMWLDDKGQMISNGGGFAVLPAGYEGNLGKMVKAQDAAIAALAPASAKRLITADARNPIFIRNVKIYDADAMRFVAGQNVVVADGKIEMVGEALPKLGADTRVIDGTGKTLLPGLWDSHMHMGDDFTALGEVALGVTSVRDPGGTTPELLKSQRERRAKGTLVGPESFASTIVDGAGPLAAQSSITVSSVEETLAAVRKIKADGMTGIKFYTSMKPEWIAPAAKLAHELGLHVHGHIPAGMRTLDAVNAGYDEITHLYFATMQAMPDEVVAKSNTTLRMTGPARYFKDVDLSAEPMKSTIRTLAERKIAVDPTLVVIEGVLLSEAGTLSPPWRAFAGTLPPLTERGVKGGPLPLPEGTTRDDARASFAKMRNYVRVLRDAGVPIVAGTDGGGPELVRELEHYVAGGMSTAEALSTATIVAARNVGADKRTGSIAVGKEADLLLVDGDPETNIGALRQVDAVILDGAYLDGDSLRREAGFNGRPKK
ncbi:MAG: amidohydrolase family protein [Sphingomicrobium sp.]